MTRRAGGTGAVPRGAGGKLITCFLPKGKALEVAELLHHEKSRFCAISRAGAGVAWSSR